METLTLEWIRRPLPGKQERGRCYEQLQTLENQSEQQTLMDFSCQTCLTITFSLILHTMYVLLIYCEQEVCSCKDSKKQRTTVLD
jgi:hypothetical protein